MVVSQSGEEFPVRHEHNRMQKYIFNIRGHPHSTRTRQGRAFSGKICTLYVCLNCIDLAQSQFVEGLNF